MVQESRIEMSVSDDLLCLFSAEIERRDGSFVVEVPDQEVELGGVEPDEPIRVALVSPVSAQSGAESETVGSKELPSRGDRVPEPPVEEGEVREVEIEDVGEQGDGIARIDRGYIVFVPGTSVGDRVTIEVIDVRQNFAFGEPINGQI